VPRLRQAVLAARELEPAVERLRAEAGLGEPYADPGVEYFGLGNAVFALGDTFLEVVSPRREGTAAGRLLDRRGGDCGYMVMAQVDDLAGARERARALGIREVLGVELDDIAEYLHPADIGGAIVAMSEPKPPAAWRWGGPEWERRAVPGLRVAGATLAVDEPDAVARRWEAVIGVLPGITFVEDAANRGLIEIEIAGLGERGPIDVGGLRLVSDR
jgi:hypothetical protein